MTGLKASTYHVCPMVTWAKCISMGDQHDSNSLFMGEGGAIIA